MQCEFKRLFMDMIKVIEEMLSDFGDVVLDRFEDESKGILEAYMFSLDSYINLESTPDHIKILCSYIKLIIESAYVNNYKTDAIH
tara:strand:- start:1157 stop:1411 length:255 start_codon:yes stop_codon:yes gene_type:complete